MGRKPNNEDVIFRPKPIIDEQELLEYKEKVWELEQNDVEGMEIIFGKVKSMRSFFASVEISNSKELKPAREAMVALENKYRKLNAVEMELIDANISYLRVQKKISKNDTLAKDCMPFCNEAELHYLKVVKKLLEAMVDMEKKLLTDLDAFEKLMTEIKAKQAKHK
jgi:hypothetical protein